MFYSCLAMLLLLVVMGGCVTVAAVDIDQYNAGLVVVLLCAVGILVSCACCIGNPDACQDPDCYRRCCLRLEQLQMEVDEEAASTGTAPVQRDTTASATAYRRYSTIMHASVTERPSRSGSKPAEGSHRATIVMLTPAMLVMNNFWRGMAWIADDENEDEDHSTDSHSEPQVIVQQPTFALPRITISQCSSPAKQSPDEAPCNDAVTYL